MLDVTKLVTEGDCARCASPCMQRWSTCDTSALVPSHPGSSCLESFLRCCAGCETFYPTCSGHGSCIGSGLCSCTTGYGGNDCSAGILFLMACAITATPHLRLHSASPFIQFLPRVDGSRFSAVCAYDEATQTYNCGCSKGIVGDTTP